MVTYTEGCQALKLLLSVIVNDMPYREFSSHTLHDVVN